MSEWLRALSPPLRYLVYVAGVILVFFVAVGVGATATVLADWQSGRVGPGPAQTGALEGSSMETTSLARKVESTRTEPSGDSDNANDTLYKASFVHRADQENSSGDYTYIGDPNIDGDANALVLVSPTSDAGTYGRNIGVWYESGARRWAIFNQDRAPVPTGAGFEVRIPQDSVAFLHQADLLNTVGNYTYLDNRLTNGRPDAVLSFTQNWNPGGGTGVYNNHPVGVMYDDDVGQWAIYNRDGAPVPEGAAFNITVSAGTNESAR